MAFPTSTTDVIVGAMESRRKKVQDNITKNNALLTHLKEKGRILFVTGGNIILEELSFAENGNANYYSGYDLLPVAAQDVIGAAQFTLKQAAVPVVISGLELLQNDGREKQLDLMEARLGVAEGTLANIITQGLYSDGTIFNGKALVGLDAAAEATVTASQTSTYGGISQTNFSFWRSQCTSTSADISTAAKCQGVMNALWATTIRGADMPDFGIMDNNFWADWTASLQVITRFLDAKKASLGFMTQQYMGADIYLDGGIDGRDLLLPEQQVPQVPSTQGPQLRRALSESALRRQPGRRGGHPGVCRRIHLLRRPVLRPRQGDHGLRRRHVEIRSYRSDCWGSRSDVSDCHVATVAVGIC